MLGNRLESELSEEAPRVRRRVIATTLFDAAQEMARSAGSRASGSAAQLMPLAQQIDLWFLHLGSEAAVAKSADAAAVYVRPMLRPVRATP